MVSAVTRKPNFSSPFWLGIGVVAGIALIALPFLTFPFIKVFYIAMGVVLSIHCLEMMRYWKCHSVVYNGDIKKARIVMNGKVWLWRRITWWTHSIAFAWKQTSFRIGVIVCTLGIVIGLVVGIGMTQLCLLVAIACLGWGLEVANTSIETLLDIVNPKISPKVKIVKDAFSAVPIFVYSAYAISWLILVVPSIISWIFERV